MLNASQEECLSDAYNYCDGCNFCVSQIVCEAQGVCSAYVGCHLPYISNAQCAIGQIWTPLGCFDESILTTNSCAALNG